jgi:hypothetical protein
VAACELVTCTLDLTLIDFDWAAKDGEGRYPNPNNACLALWDYAKSMATVSSDSAILSSLVR